MAQLGSYARLLIDSYLVTSHTTNIELNMSRGETETPTHEDPTAFILNELTGEMTVSGYISQLPNAFILEKRLQAVFDDPDGTHYAALILDYRIGSGWDPAYIGTINSPKMDIKAVSNSVVTINGTFRMLSLSRPGLGDNWEDLRANCIYYEDLKALTAATPVFGTYTDLTAAPDKINVIVFTWEKSGVGALTWNLEESAGGEGAGTELFAEDEAIGTSAAVDSAVSSSIAQQYIRKARWPRPRPRTCSRSRRRSSRRAPIRRRSAARSTCSNSQHRCPCPIATAGASPNCSRPPARGSAGCASSATATRGCSSNPKRRCPRASIACSCARGSPNSRRRHRRATSAPTSGPCRAPTCASASRSTEHPKGQRRPASTPTGSQPTSTSSCTTSPTRRRACSCAPSAPPTCSGTCCSTARSTARRRTSRRPPMRSRRSPMRFWLPVRF